MWPSFSFDVFCEETLVFCGEFSKSPVVLQFGKGFLFGTNFVHNSYGQDF